MSAGTSLDIDFTTPERLYRLKQASINNEPLAKAINLKKYPNPKVLDCTAGIGRDMMIMAYLGCSVVALERHPEVYQALVNALEEAKSHPLLQTAVSRIQLYNQNAISYLNQTDTVFDIIYCDPMFDPKKKTAKVKKEMQQLQTLVGFEQDQQDKNSLFLLALDKAKEKTIIKTHTVSPPIPLDVRVPTTQLTHKTVHFYIYQSAKGL